MAITLAYDEFVAKVKEILAAAPEGLNPQTPDWEGGGCQYQTDENTIVRPNTESNCVIGRLLKVVGAPVPGPEVTENARAVLGWLDGDDDNSFNVDAATAEFANRLQEVADGQEVVLGNDIRLTAIRDHENEVTEPRPWGEVLQYVDQIADDYREGR